MKSIKQYITEFVVNKHINNIKELTLPEIYKYIDENILAKIDNNITYSKVQTTSTAYKTILNLVIYEWYSPKVININNNTINIDELEHIKNITINIIDNVINVYFFNEKENKKLCIYKITSMGIRKQFYTLKKYIKK